MKYSTTSRNVTVLLFCALFGSLVYARGIQGPEISSEYRDFASVALDGSDDGDLDVASRRDSARLVAPLPFPFLGGMLVAKGDFFKEHRSYRGDDAPAWRGSDFESPDVGGIGAIYLPRPMEGAPRFFIVAARYGRLSLSQSETPMGEYVIGSDIDEEDLPFSLRFNATDETKTRILVRLRRFPGHQKWLFLLGHDIHTKSGWSLELHIPSHGQVAWENNDWKIYLSGRGESREYPINHHQADERAWIDGYAAIASLGVRRHLSGIFHISVEGGMQKEAGAVISESGETLSRYESLWAPWGKVAIETWLRNP